MPTRDLFDIWELLDKYYSYYDFGKAHRYLKEPWTTPSNCRYENKKRGRTHHCARAHRNRVICDDLLGVPP